jgi:transcription elongation factor Elf1
MLRTRGRPSLDEREDAARALRRRAAHRRKWTEERVWFLRCPSCEHEGEVCTTLKRLRASNLKCSACGAYLWHAGARN